MQELLEVARKLRDLFGWQASVVESFGTNEATPADRAEEITHGEGITAEELEAEIERVLDPRSRLDKDKEGREGGPGGRRWINVSPDESFTPLSTLVKIPFDPAAQAKGAALVARPARQMRTYLEGLGLSMIPERRRLTGRRFDTTRTLAVVLRSDPRMLVARRVQRTTDLFLGVLIDCSGSMQSHANIEKAKLFGSMLAEAARGLRGIDLALFGFTHDVIFDAGDASRCAVHGLEASGGNNDAGALWYAANAAKASRRRAKLLVMISDGLPTECSVEALRSLVSRLHNRERIACAQVAVQPLTEVCFPHYVVLSEADEDAAVRRFGSIVASLVQKTLAGA
jgi:Mg-chelatase subunit ChlD